MMKTIILISILAFFVIFIVYHFLNINIIEGNDPVATTPCNPATDWVKYKFTKEDFDKIVAIDGMNNIPGSNANELYDDLVNSRARSKFKDDLDIIYKSEGTFNGKPIRSWWEISDIRRDPLIKPVLEDYAKKNFKCPTTPAPTTPAPTTTAPTTPAPLPPTEKKELIEDIAKLKEIDADLKREGAEFKKEHKQMQAATTPEEVTKIAKQEIITVDKILLDEEAWETDIRDILRILIDGNPAIKDDSLYETVMSDLDSHHDKIEELRASEQKLKDLLVGDITKEEMQEAKGDSGEMETEIEALRDLEQKIEHDIQILETKYDPDLPPIEGDNGKVNYAFTFKFV
jgi:hypothetical protein